MSHSGTPTILPMFLLRNATACPICPICLASGVCGPAEFKPMLGRCQERLNKATCRAYNALCGKEKLGVRHKSPARRGTWSGEAVRGISRYVRLWLALARYGLIRELSFRGNFLIKVTVEILWLAILLIFYRAVFART